MPPDLPLHAQARQDMVVSARVGDAQSVESEVWFRRHGTTKYLPLSVGVTLTGGDTLITGQDGRAQVSRRFRFDSLAQLFDARVGDEDESRRSAFRYFAR